MPRAQHRKTGKAGRLENAGTFGKGGAFGALF